MDNGEAFKQLVQDHLQTAMRLFAGFMETMDPDMTMRMLEHLGKGAHPAVTVFAPEPGTGASTLELSLVHPEAGALLLQRVTASVSPPVGQRH